MLQVNFYINNTRIKEPLNYRELSLELNFDKDDPDVRGQVTTNRWEIGLGDKSDNSDGSRLIQTYVNNGLIGGTGVFEGIPFRIDLQNNSQIQTLFDGYLDLSKAELTCSRINANAIESGGIDWLNEIADSFTFEYLYEQRKIITDADFVKVPYLLTSVPDIYTAAITGVTLYSVLNQLKEAVNSLIEKIPEFLIPNFGNIITSILVSIQITILLVASILLIVQLYKLLVPRVKYHAGMYVYTLCERACKHLGLTFNSTILESNPYNKLLIMPESYFQYEPTDKGIKRFTKFSNVLLGVQNLNNFERVGYYRGTFGQLLRELKNLFNAKLILSDGNLRLERIDYINNSSIYTLPNVDKSDLPYTFNSDEFYPFYSLSFIADTNDRNILQYYVGNEIQVIQSPKVINNQNRVIGGGSKEIKIGFARGKIRTKKNFIERMFGDVFDNIYPLIQSSEKLRKAAKKRAEKVKRDINKFKKVLSTIGIKFKEPSRPKETEQQVDNFINDLRDIIFRKSNVLLMETDFVAVPKLLLMEADYKNWQNELFVKLDKGNDVIVNMLHFYTKFHIINTFVGNESNQGIIYEIPEIPFCYEDYMKVKNNNIIFDSDGTTRATIISLRWNPFKQTASVRYKRMQKYTDNIKQELILSDGR